MQRGGATSSQIDTDQPQFKAATPHTQARKGMNTPTQTNNQSDGWLSHPRQTDRRTWMTRHGLHRRHPGCRPWSQGSRGSRPACHLKRTKTARRSMPTLAQTGTIACCPWSDATRNQSSRSVNGQHGILHASISHPMRERRLSSDGGPPAPAPHAALAAPGRTPSARRERLCGEEGSTSGKRVAGVWPHERHQSIPGRCANTRTLLLPLFPPTPARHTQPHAPWSSELVNELVGLGSWPQHIHSSQSAAGADDVVRERVCRHHVKPGLALCWDG